MSGTGHTVLDVDKLIDMPAAMEGTRFLEVTYTVGAAQPVVAHDWPLVGWTNDDNATPVVAELDGHLAAKHTALHPQQITGGSATFFVTRLVGNPLDVGPMRRDLVAMLRSALATDTSPAVDDVDLPA